MSFHDNKYQASLDTPEEINSKYIIIKELGKGAYGTVYLAEDRQTKEQYAIKRIDDVFRTRIDAKRTFREITILRQCNHPNIAKLRDVLLPPDEETFQQLWMVQEYGGWDLSKVLKSAKRIAGWCDKHVKSVIYQTLCGLLYMQSKNIVHRDLKPSNILVDSKCNVKIVDFGLARQMSCSRDVAFSAVDTSESNIWDTQSNAIERQLTQHVVTRWYRAPELILMQNGYSGAIDMWSVGCIMAELLQTLEPHVTRIKPLFPGTTCFPLSAPRKDKDKHEKIEEEFKAETHQLEKIFEITGTPSIEDIELLDEGPMKNERNFLRNLNYVPSQDYFDVLPSASVEAVELMKCMLNFNPNKRISVEDAIHSSYFDDVRNVELEVVDSQTMVFPFEAETNCGDANEKQRLRQLIYKEALIFSNFQKTRTPKQRSNTVSSGVSPCTTSSGHYVVPKEIYRDRFKSDETNKQCIIL